MSPACLPASEQCRQPHPTFQRVSRNWAPVAPHWSSFWISTSSVLACLLFFKTVQNAAGGKRKKGLSGCPVAKTARFRHRLQGTRVRSLIQELRPHMLNGPAPHPPTPPKCFWWTEESQDGFIVCRTSRTWNFFFKVKHSQLVTGWELPRVPLLARVHVVWPLHDPGQHRLLISSEGDSLVCSVRSLEIPYAKMTLTSTFYEFGECHLLEAPPGDLQSILAG